MTNWREEVIGDCRRIERAYQQPDFFIEPPSEKPKQQVML